MTKRIPTFLEWFRMSHTQKTECVPKVTTGTTKMAQEAEDKNMKKTEKFTHNGKWYEMLDLTQPVVFDTPLEGCIISDRYNDDGPGTWEVSKSVILAILPGRNTYPVISRSGIYRRAAKPCEPPVDLESDRLSIKQRMYKRLSEMETELRLDGNPLIASILRDQIHALKSEFGVDDNAEDDKELAPGTKVVLTLPPHVGTVGEVVRKHPSGMYIIGLGSPHFMKLFSGRHGFQVK